MPENSVKMTPMLEQYTRIKAQHPDALLFYRMGDFYELFFEDARIAARELQIALTSRNRDAQNPVPMCGVPWHAVEGYLAQLIDKGYNVAICDQTENPKEAKGLVKRAVTRIITPATVLEDVNLNSKSHNYLGAICLSEDSGTGAFAWADISTGQWSGAEFRREAELWQWVQKIAPRELLAPEGCAPPHRSPLEGIRLVSMPLACFDFKRATERVIAAQKVQDAAALGLDGKTELMRACGALLAYLFQTQMHNPDHLTPFVPLDMGRRLVIDDVTERNLEIFSRLNGRKGKGTLRHVLDDTMTPMGGRLLEDMLRHPWREAVPIRRIQDAVAFFSKDDNHRAALREALKNVYDLERLSTRISLNQGAPRDFVALRNSLAALPTVFRTILPLSSGHGNAQTPQDLPHGIASILAAWDSLEDCAALLTRALADPPPAVITEGGLFRPGFNEELDKLLDLEEHGEQKLQSFLEKEQKSTGISKLKMGYNRVFGYYYEITRAAHNGPLPEHFIRRQTLANAERFTTEELKKLEEELLSATERRKALEYKLFQDLRGHMAAQRERILHTADLVANLDYWQCLAHVGRTNQWQHPELTTDATLEIRDGRHPVVEAMIGRANFVPNDFRLDATRRLCLLTGPNMSGKSTILRQVAIICLLAQMGSPVPAASARLGLVDRLFSRVGASDNLARGQSTFMVEMMETARILRQATRRSLIILDEIGRGTSTYDGVALAWAVVEDLAKRAGQELRTLFATHYHELTALEGRVAGVFTMNIAIREHNNDILFLHRLIPGPSDRSYGVEVARLAGVPGTVVQRAKAILASLEQGRESARKNVLTAVSLPGISTGSRNSPSAALPMQAQPEHPLTHTLQTLNPDTLSPLEALKLLTEWKMRWGAKKAQPSALPGEKNA